MPCLCGSDANEYTSEPLVEVVCHLVHLPLADADPFRKGTPDHDQHHLICVRAMRPSYPTGPGHYKAPVDAQSRDYPGPSMNLQQWVCLRSPPNVGGRKPVIVRIPTSHRAAHCLTAWHIAPDHLLRRRPRRPPIHHRIADHLGGHPSAMHVSSLYPPRDLSVS
jgi:hypothetical protein